MTDILDTIRLAADAGHAAWKEGYQEAKSELMRRLRQVPTDQDSMDYAVQALAIVREFIA